MAISRKELLALANDVDAGIQKAVVILNMFNFDTCQSCEGKYDLDGRNTPSYMGEHEHCYPEPTVDFNGGVYDGFKAFVVAKEHGLEVSAVRREWKVIDGELIGPIWSMTFNRRIKPLTEQEIIDYLDWYEL